MPDEWRTREWVTSNPDAKDGYVEASGQWDLLQAQGAVHLKLHRFPALQRSDRYAMVSGTVDIDAQLPRISISGDLKADRSEEHTSELQSLMRISYAVFCLKKKTTNNRQTLHKT